MSYCVDTNVFITAWYVTYPPRIFPSLYREMESKLPNKIILIKPIFDEIEPISGSKKSAEELRKEHPVRFWLKEQMGIDETPIDDNVKQKSLELMSKYKTEESAKGASENDIKLIAYASIHSHTVVTLESEQKQKPNSKSNYKIPLICKIENVECIDFIEMLNQCGIKV